MKKSILYLLISFLTFIVGYLFLKTSYLASMETPFTQEIILVVLGTIATMAITAALLNKQSEVEIEKEQRVKIFDLKTDLYFQLINSIEKIITAKKISEKDLIILEFLTHKISTLASISVLNEYTKFLSILKKISQDGSVSEEESQNLSRQLAKLCGKIRAELNISNDASSQEEEIQKILDTNIKIL